MKKTSDYSATEKSSPLSVGEVKRSIQKIID